MKINYTWLKDYIDIKKSPEETANILTMSGSEVKAIDKIGDDCVMDIEITPNRSDCLSYIGIAREICALTGAEVKMPPIKAKKRKSSGKTPFTVEIRDKDLCPRYTARLIKGVNVGESPEWLKKKIVSIGLRPVNNIVDITNYVLFELGQPMHAFDYDKIKGKSVIIRRGRTGEKITSIDNVERKLEKDMLVIADQEGPIAVGGVMGGLDTEVADKTRNVLLESAYFDPISVRRTSFKLALMSESSYRFERGVDPGMVLGASDRAALLISTICGGKICELLDKGHKSDEERKVFLRIDRLNKILDLDLKKNYVKDVLSGLGLRATAKKGVIEVSVPSFRQDIRYEIDLIEEIARIYGYENISMTIPRIVSNPERKSLSWRAREKASAVLTSLGLNEVVTYGLTSKSNMQKFFSSGILEKTIIPVKNYLSFDQEVMRTSLIPGVVNALSWNVNRGIKDLKMFEIGKVYGKDYHYEDYRYEKTNLCVALTGLISADWQRQKNNATFFDLKGMLELVFGKLGLEVGKFEFAMPEVSYKGKPVGSISVLDEAASDLKQNVFLAEIDFDALMPSVDLEKKFTEIPKFPSIKRDISLIAGGDVSFAKISAIVEEQSGGLVEKIELFDKYAGKQIPAGQHGLSFRIEYRDKHKTLTSEEVDKIHTAIRNSLAEKLGVTLR
jgi:phenylalanyl-tRNA synthetase beta chain